MAVDLGTRTPDIERTLQQAPQQAAEAVEVGLERAGEALGGFVNKLQDSVEDADIERELRETSSRLRSEAEQVVDEMDPPTRDQAALFLVALVVSMLAIATVVVLRQRAEAKRAEARAKRRK